MSKEQGTTDGMAETGLRKWPYHEDIIITQADLQLCLGSGELRCCPFCGSSVISTGQKTENGKAVRWKIQCGGVKEGSSIVPDCFASVIGVDPDQAVARAEAVRRWNRRAGLQVPEKVKYWLLNKLAKEQANVRAREHMAAVSRRPGEEIPEVAAMLQERGARLDPGEAAAREEEAQRDARIAAKCREEVEMWKEVLGAFGVVVDW